MSLSHKYGPCALIAGASEGIGAAFARHLAEEGIDLVLVARRKEPLEKLASLLIEKYRINVECIACDLSEDNSAFSLKETLRGKEVSLLVYNAAHSYIGRFEKNSPENHKKIAVTNMITPVNMIHLLGEPMLKKGRGAIILMASLAGFQGSGFLSAYAASKAFLRVMAESLWYEWKDKGVDVIACCAGATATPNYIETKPGKSGFFAPAVMNPDQVIRECMKQLGKKPSIITGRGNRIASFVMQKLLPRKMAINIMGETTRKMYRQQIENNKPGVN